MRNQSIAKLDPHFARRVVALVAIGFLALIASAIATAWVQARNQDNARLVEHTLEVEAQISAFSSLIERAETARRGVLLSGDPTFIARMAEAAVGAQTTFDEITRLTADNDRQRRRGAAMQPVLQEWRAYQQRSTRASGAELNALIANFSSDRGVQLTRRIRAIADEMIADERQLLSLRNADQEGTLRTFYAILALTGALVIVVATLTLLLMLRYTRDLAASRAELRGLNEGLEEMVSARTAELQRANDEIQRFAYIVSHDLRSPLVNVMGFTAELDSARNTIAKHLAVLEAKDATLVEEPVRLAVQEDLPEAIGFIRTSTQKMDRLINAILRLSREGRRTLAVETIDMDALVQSIIDSLQHRLTDAGAKVHAEMLPRIESDRLAVEQILSNLIENAVKYLKPGRPGMIHVRGHIELDRAIFEVVDNGRGVDPRDHERIFDLFRRSGVQDQAGEGIGLAHVRALAYRLGGLIELRSELDRGSTFRLSMPRILRAAEVK